MNRGVTVALILLVIGLGCWWMLASKPPIPAVSSDPGISANGGTATAPKLPRRDTERETPAVPGIEIRVVAEETKEPIAGATVSVREENRPPRDATTGADGVAQVPGPVPAEETHIVASAPGRVRDIYWANAEELWGDTPVTISLAAAVSAEGIVFGADGQPLGGARVVGNNAPGDDADCVSEDPPFAAATTKADGTFRLDGLRASAKTGVTIRARRHLTKYVTWDPAAPSRIEVHLARGGVITGIVRDPSGAPVEHAEVRAWPVSDVPEGTPSVGEVRTDASGRFELDGVALVGAWTVDAGKDGFADALQGEAVVDAAHLEAACDLALRPVARIEVLVLDPSGKPDAEVRVAYEADGVYGGTEEVPDGRWAFEITRPGRCRVTVEPKRWPFFETEIECGPGETKSLTVRLVTGVSISGLLVDDADAPVAFADVRAQGGAGSQDQAFSRKGTTAGDGTFTVSGLEERPYTVHAAASAYQPGRVEGVRAPATGVRIVLVRAGWATLRLRLPPGSPPPESRSVEFVRREHQRTEKTAGAWSSDDVSMELWPGTWDVDIDVDGYARAIATVEIKPGEETTMSEILLDPGVTLAGRVEDLGGHGVEGAIVRRGAAEAKSGPDGRFEMQHVAAGEVPVLVERGGFLPTTHSHDLAAGSAPLLVKLARGGVLKGVFRKTSGTGPEVFRIEVLSGERFDRYEVEDAVWREDATFSHRLPAGRYRVELRRESTVVDTRDVEVREGEETQVELVAK